MNFVAVFFLLGWLLLVAATYWFLRRQFMAVASAYVLIFMGASTLHSGRLPQYRGLTQDLDGPLAMLGGVLLFSLGCRILYLIYRKTRSEAALDKPKDKSGPG